MARINMLLLDALWRLTPMWLGAVVFRLTGCIWTRQFDPETNRTVAYFFSKTVPVELGMLAGQTFRAILARSRGMKWPN